MCTCAWPASWPAHTRQKPNRQCSLLTLHDKISLPQSSFGLFVVVVVVVVQFLLYCQKDLCFDFLSMGFGHPFFASFLLVVVALNKWMLCVS